jgi:hypothetical protein
MSSLAEEDLLLPQRLDLAVQVGGEWFGRTVRHRTA